MRMSIADAAIATAWIWANRGTCPKKKVGATVISSTGRVVATGYNGSPAGEPHCTDHGCILDGKGKCTRAIHAEDNALTLAATRALGSTLYTTHFPCEGCAAKAVFYGVAEIVYEVDRKMDERRARVLKHLRLAGIPIRQHKQGTEKW